MFVTEDDTALEGDDYEAKSGTVTFQVGETLKQVTFTVLGDSINELDEEFDIQLSNVTGASLGDSRGRVTIDDNDAQPTISVSDASVVEGTDGVVNAVFVVRLSAPSGQAVSVMVATADVTATTDSDYATTSQLIEFEPGATTAAFIVLVNGDTTAEGFETFAVNATIPTGATIADTQGIGVIHETAPAAPWQNVARPFDSDNDGTVTEDDALAMIDYLNANGSRILAAPVPGDVPLYLDASGNNRVTPLDVLLIINFLDRAGLWPPATGLAAAAPTPIAVAADDLETPVETFAAASTGDANWLAEEPQVTTSTGSIVKELSAHPDTTAGAEPDKFNPSVVDAVLVESATGLSQGPAKAAAGDDLFDCAFGAGTDRPPVDSPPAVSARRAVSRNRDSQAVCSSSNPRTSQCT